MTGESAKSMQELIPFEEALGLVLQSSVLCASEHVPLEETPGRTLAEDVVSREDLPPFSNSGMDGYAVRASDMTAAPVTLRVVEDIPAGGMPSRRIDPGCCARIMTGAPVPEGADAVVPVEWTSAAGPESVRIERSIETGRNIRLAGGDVRRGEVVLSAGQVITPPSIGMLAAVGAARVPVRIPPIVAVVSTGSELVEVSVRPGPGQIRNSNGPALIAQAASAGARPLRPIHAPDDKHRIREGIEEALEADVLVFSGGVSVGDYDYVKEVLDDMGMKRLFWKVRQRPGKPLAFGHLKGKPVFGLPGNPVSSAICFEMYVRPFLAAMLGRSMVRRPRWPARLAEPIAKHAGLHYFARGRVFPDEEGRLSVRLTGSQASNVLSSVVGAEVIVHLHEALENPAEGTAVEIEWLPWC